MAQALKNRLRDASLFALCAAGLALAACGSAPRETFDLAAGAPRPLKPTRLREGTAAVAVEAPKASDVLDSYRIVIRDRAGGLDYLEGAQWSDRAPQMVQARLIETFRASGVDAVYPGAVARLRLSSMLERFEIDAARGVAIVEITARLANETSGAARGTARFVGEAEAEHTLGPYAARALDAALARAAERVAAWTWRTAR